MKWILVSYLLYRLTHSLDALPNIRGKTKINILQPHCKRRIQPGTIKTTPLIGGREGEGCGVQRGCRLLYG